MAGGTGYTTFFRALDPRIGRWQTPDPMVFPWQSPYCSMNCNPIGLVDPLGAAAGEGDPPKGGEDTTLGPAGDTGVDDFDHNIFNPGGEDGLNLPSSLSNKGGEPSTLTLGEKLGNLIADKFGSTMTLDEFKQVNMELNIFLCNINEQGGDKVYRLKNSSYNDGAYGFNIQEITRDDIQGNLVLYKEIGGSVIDYPDDKAGWVGELSDDVGAYMPANTFKEVVFDVLRVAGELGKVGQTYLKVLKWTGVVGSVIGMGSSSYNIIHDYDKAGHGIRDVDYWDVADLVVGTGGLICTFIVASTPVGWGIAIGTGVYFLTRLIYEKTHEDE